MASYRPYRPALPMEQALGEIESFKGVRYDPTVVDVCLRLVREGQFVWQDGVVRAAQAIAAGAH